MSSQPTIEQAKNAHRDAASILLFLFREDIDSVKAILDANQDDPRPLTSGIISVAAMIVAKAFGMEQSVEAMESLVDYLANVPDEDWQILCNNSRFV